MIGKKWWISAAAAASVIVGGAGVWWATRLSGAPHRHVIGFVVPWDRLSLQSLKEHAGSLTEVALPAFRVGATGQAVDLVDPEFFAAVKETGLPALATVTNFDRAFNPALAHLVCATPAARDRFAESLVSAARRRGFRGINLDLENVPEADASGYAALAAAVRQRASRAGIRVSVDVPVQRANAVHSGFDVKGLAAASDLLVAMLYDEHGPASEPGPIAGRPWVRDGLREALTLVPAEKLVLGVGTYGYDWSRTGPGEEVSYSHALSLAASASRPITWDAEARAPHFDYHDSRGEHHVWFEDAGTGSGRLRDALAARCAGVALWRLGDEDPELWHLTDGYRAGHAQTELSSQVNLAPITTVKGEGDLFTIHRGRASGSRQVQWENGEVAEERYSPLLSAFALERYLPVQPKQVALTFDDGPNGANTPRLLDELKRENVKATFFLIGQNVAENPDLVRRIYAEGHDIGNHTFTHPHMELVSPLQARLEVNLNQRLIESVIGHRTALFRRPYDVNNAPVEPEEMRPLLAAADAHYLLCGASVDPADWSGAGADRIAADCLRQLGASGADGHVIVMHDGGGNRDATLAAVPRVIEQLRARGYQFVTLHELIGRPRDVVMEPAGAEPLVARAGLEAVSLLVRLGVVGQALVIGGLLFLVLRLVFTTSGALIQFRRTRRNSAPAAAVEDGPLVSVLVPAYNEEQVIGATITSLLASTYAHLEILVIDDGSKDGTYEAALRATSDPRVRVLRKENGGKGMALNWGLERASGEWVVAIDADTIFEPETISYLVEHLRDPKVGAVAGNIKIGNATSLLTCCQHVEYIVGINLDKRFFDLLGCVPVVPGAVGAWRKSAIQAVGGYSAGTMAEDADLTLSVQRAGYRVVYEDRARAWTEAPTSVECLMKQRLRWTFGTLQCLWKHRTAFFNPKSGSLGMVGMPYIAFYHALLLAGPLVDGLFILGCLAGWWKTMLLLSLPYLGVELGMAALAFWMDGEPVWNIWPVVAQRLGYRQLIYWTMFRSVLMACKGVYLPWQKPRRLAALAPSVAARKQ